MIILGKMHTYGIVLVATFYIVEVALEPLQNLVFGLTYVLFPTLFAGNTVDQI